jgi:hypothetical protein
MVTRSASLEQASVLELERKPGKNYIGILNDTLEDERETVPPAKSDRPVRKYILALMAAVLNRGADAR